MVHGVLLHLFCTENAVLRPLSPERQDVDDLLSAPSGRAILPPWNDDLELKHLEASQAVGKLTAEVCVELLRRWLVSLGACDCSLMISLRSLVDDAAQSCRQGQDSSGVVIHSGTCVSVAYHIQALDLGPKPPQKIRSKGREEDTILRLAFGK